MKTSSIKLLTAVFNSIVTARHLHPSLTSVGTAGAYPSKETLSVAPPSAMPANVRLGCKLLSVTYSCKRFYSLGNRSWKKYFSIFFEFTCEGEREKSMPA
jgi:hypothetical protein